MNIAKMNTKSLAAKMGATALVALTFIVCASTAVAGTKDGGGGNAQPSTRADLEEFVANIGPRQFWEISDAYLVGEKIQMTSSPLKPELAEITGKILGLPVFTINDSI
ncbi:MAG: hypothetical protein ACXVA9_13775, partial [Bdellovibrionales bacterium]